MIHRLLAGAAVLCASACFNFDADYAHCFDAGHCDGSAPELLSSSPAPLATSVPLNPSFTLIFSEPMDTQATSASLDAVALANPSWDEDNTRLTLTALAELAESTSYVLTVEGQDLAGNALNNAQIAFTTRGPQDTTPPSITGHSPAEGAAGVQTTHKLHLSFSEPMDRTSLAVTVTPAYDLGEPTWSLSDARVDFLAPPEVLAAGMTYTVSVTAKDAAQNLLIDDTEFSFTTQPPPDTTAPTLVSTTPETGAANVPQAQTLSFIFSEQMTSSTASTLVSFSPSIPSYELTWYNDGTLLEVNPASDLAGSTTYTVSLSTDLQDASGNAFAGGSITFTTAAAPDTTAPAVVSTSPANGATGVLRHANLVITFSEPMDRANTQAAFSVYSPARTGVFTWNADSTQLVFNPDVDFAHNTLVQWQISTTARDQAGNALPYTSGSFRTVREATVVLTSDPKLDGEIFAGTSVNTTSNVAYTGDDSAAEEYEAYFHFPLAALPSTLVQITSATLSVYQASVINAPYGTLVAESVEYGTSLGKDDFNTPTLDTCSRTCDFRDIVYQYPMSTSSANGWKTATVTGAVRNDWAERSVRGSDSQWRLAFPHLPDGDKTAEYAGFYTAEAPSSRPTLSVTYEYP